MAVGARLQSLKFRITAMTIGDVEIRGGGFIVAARCTVWLEMPRPSSVEMTMLCGCLCSADTVVVRLKEREEKGRRKGKGQMRKKNN